MRNEKVPSVIQGQPLYTEVMQAEMV